MLVTLLVAVSACGMEANKGSHTAINAATDYVAALSDKDYDRARALRDPEEFKQTVFDNSYFNGERARLGLIQANPQYKGTSVKDTNGLPIAGAATASIAPTNQYVNLTVVGGSSLLITATFRTDLWYVSGIEKTK